MVVLDDVGQYRDVVPPPGVRIVSFSQRFRTLGEKRNASAALVSPDVQAYCVWDDDDAYLPWHIETCAKALEHGEFCVPGYVLVQKRGGLHQKPTAGLFHGSWAFTRRAFDQVHGYPFIQSGQDQGLFARFRNAKISRADQTKFDARPSYIYRWFQYPHAFHLSSMGRGGYEKLAQKTGEPVAALDLRLEHDWVKMYESTRQDGAGDNVVGQATSGTV